MKKSRIQHFIMFLAVMILPILSYAQPGQRGSGNGQGNGQGPRGKRYEQGGERMFMNIPNLSDEQKDNLKAIHVAAQQDILPLRNEINEKEASLTTLQTDAKPDMKAINNTIDEISELKASIAKRRAIAHQDVRKQLDDEQRLFLDTQFQNKGNRGRNPDGPRRGK